MGSQTTARHQQGWHGTGKEAMAQATQSLAPAAEPSPAHSNFPLFTRQLAVCPGRAGPGAQEPVQCWQQGWEQQRQGTEGLSCRDWGCEAVAAAPWGCQDTGTAAEQVRGGNTGLEVCPGPQVQGWGQEWREGQALPCSQPRCQRGPGSPRRNNGPTAAAVTAAFLTW